MTHNLKLPRVMGFSGPAQNGKDTVADYLVENYGYVKYGMADPLKEMLYTLNPIIMTEHENSPENESFRSFDRVSDIVDTHGWEVAKKNPEIRRLLQIFGTDVGRNMIDTNLWITMANKFIDNSDKPVVITGVRFPNESTLVHKYNGKVIEVIRPGYKALQGDNTNHISEHSKPEADITLINDGTLKDLYDKVESMLLDA